MKNTIICYLLFSSFFLFSCKDDDPSPDPLVDDNHLLVGVFTNTEDLAYLGSNYAPVFAKALDETFSRLQNNDQIKSGLKESTGESQFRNLLDTALQNVFDDILSQVSNELGDSIGQANRRTGSANNIRQIGLAVHNDLPFDQALVAQMDSSLESTDRKHSNWSDLVVVSHASGLFLPDSIDIDLERTQRIYEETIYPRITVMLNDENSWKETIQFLLLQGMDAEAILLSFYIPAIKELDFDLLSAAADTISRNRSGTGNDVLLGDRGNDRIEIENIDRSKDILDYLYRASFFGMVYGLLPDQEYPEFQRAADAITSLYYGMYSATLYAYLDYVWEILHEAGLNPQAILDDFTFYQKLFESEGFVTPDLALSDVNYDDYADLKANYLNTMTSAVETTTLPFFATFKGRDGETYTPVTRSAEYLLDMLKPSMEYDDGDAIVDRLITILDTTTVRRRGVFVSSYSSSPPSENFDIQSLIGWYNQPNLRNELDGAAPSYKIDLMNQLIQEDNIVASIILPAIQGANAAARETRKILDFNSLVQEISGTAPSGFEMEIDKWENKAVDIGFYGFARAWFTASDYDCEDFHCLMINFQYEMNQHIVMFYFHQIWEYSNYLADQQTAENLSNQSDEYASLFLNTLNATLVALSDADTAESITNRANNFADYLGNAHEFVGYKYQQSISVLSAHLESDLPNAKNSLSSFVNIFGNTQDISADLGFQVTHLLSENNNESSWLKESYNENDARLFIPPLNHSIQSVSRSSIQADLVSFLENQGALQAEEVVWEHVRIREAGRSVLSSMLLQLLDQNDGILLSENLVKSYLQTALDTETLPNIDSRIERWNREIIENVLPAAALYTILEEDSYNCDSDNPCKYVNAYGDAFQLSYFYLLGRFWSYIQEVNG